MTATTPRRASAHYLLDRDGTLHPLNGILVPRRAEPCYRCPGGFAIHDAGHDSLPRERSRHVSSSCSVCSGVPHAAPWVSK